MTWRRMVPAQWFNGRALLGLFWLLACEACERWMEPDGTMDGGDIPWSVLAAAQAAAWRSPHGVCFWCSNPAFSHPSSYTPPSFICSSSFPVPYHRRLPPYRVSPATADLTTTTTTSST
uniref:Putative secreted peptide n=1 Tax=Anopheles braziliensis TaxID=58242 RepID=A0A2M3ZPX5_9DIPT